MAITITQQPSQPNGAYTKLIYVVSGSTNTSNPQFEYVMDIYESGSSDLLYRTTQPVNPAGVSIFNPAKVLQDQLSYQQTWKQIINSSSLDNGKTFYILFGEKYGTSVSSSVNIYSNLTSATASIIPASVDSNQGSFNLLDVTPRVSPLESSFPIPLRDSQLSDNPYLFHSSASYPWGEDQDTDGPGTTISERNHVLLSDNDYFTTGYFITGSAELGTITVKLYDEQYDLIFDGMVFDDTGNISNRAYYTGSNFNLGRIPVIDLGVGPINLRGIPMRAEQTSSLGDQTFGQVLDSGSWLRYQVEVIGSLSDSYKDLTLVFNERKTAQIPAVKAIGPGFLDGQGTPYNIIGSLSIPLPNVCKEKVRFVFVNKYGFWDYYTNYNPVRRSRDIERDTTTLPNVDYSGLSSTFDIAKRGEKSYFTDVKDRFVVDTPLLDKVIANWLEQLIESPSVFIQRGDEFIPISITNSSYTSNTNQYRQKLFQYTIEFEPAKQPYGEWTPEFVNPIESNAWGQLGYSSVNSSIACSNYPQTGSSLFNVIVFGTNSTFENNTQFYTNSQLTDLYNPSDGYYSNGSGYVQYSGGSIVSSGVCSS